EVLGSMFIKRRRESAGVFSSELAVWDAAGFFYGKHFCRTAGSRRVKAPNSQNAGRTARGDSKLNRLAHD
ncbi:MAG TPA: hypothetical protein VNO24_04025, partial [Blastocatellia bacterium]|nr:hypothetical protein [Blastocatellia bacterium]